MNDGEVFATLWARFGEKQLIVAIEELSELQKELCKTLRDEKRISARCLPNNVENICEEVADVELMLAQLKALSPRIKSRVDFHRKLKMARLKKMLGDE